jgi:hypothetical protein
MGLKLDYLKVYPIFEERCEANQIIAQLKVVRDDDITPHIVYKKYESDEEVYNYITVNDVNGNVHLTIDGVNAINEDHDDPSKDIHELNFKIRAEDTEVGDHLDVNVNVAVVRYHDEPPKILEDMVYDIYQDDAQEGKIVLDIRTMYPAYFFVADDNAEKFHFPIADFGRLTMTNAGVDYIKNLNVDEVNHIDIKIEIKDKQNAKVIYKTYTIPIKKGSALQAVPKKSILEQIAQYLGEDLAYKIEKLNQEVKDLYNKENLIFNEFIDLDGPILNSFTGDNIYDYFLGNNGKITISSTDYIFYDIEKLLNKIFDNSSEMLNKTIIQYLEANREPINYNQRQLIDLLQKVNLENIATKNLSLFEIGPQAVFFNFFKALENQMNERIKKVLIDIISPMLEDIREEYWDEFERVEKDYLKFKKYDMKYYLQRIMQEIFEIQDILYKDDWSTVKNYISDQSSQDKYKNEGLIGRVWFHEDEIIDLQDLLYNHNSNSFSGNQEYVYGYIPTTIENKKNRYGLIGIVYDIDHRKLEDWGGSGSNDWVMSTNSGGVKVIRVGTTTVFEKNNSTTTVKAESKACLEAGSYTACVRSNGFYVNEGNGDVYASYFHGTAIQAEYADLAEFYEADKNYEPGTVLMIGGEKEVTEFKYGEGPYIGIVSENPGLILNSKKDSENFVLIGLRGRIKVKLEKGLKIKKGQALYVSMKEPGVAGIEKNEFFIGYALKQLNDEYALIVV